MTGKLFEIHLARVANRARQKSARKMPEMDAIRNPARRSRAVGAAAAVLAHWAAGWVAPAAGRFALGAAAFGIIAIPGIWWLGDEALREVLRSVLGRLRRSPRD